MTERKLTDEVREQLLGVLPFSVSSTIEHTPKTYDEIPEEYRPVFKLRPFNKVESDAVRALMLKISTMKPLEIEKKTREQVRACLMGWENMLDIGSMQMLDYKEQAGDGGCDRDLFDIVPVSVVGDMFYFLSRMSGLLNIEKLGLNS